MYKKRYSYNMTELLQKVFAEAAKLPPFKQDEMARRIEEMLKNSHSETEQVSQRGEVGQQKGKWAKVAQRLSQESPLTGLGEEFRKHSREFREGFDLKTPLETIK